MQIVDAFEEMVQLLQQLKLSLNTLILLVFLDLLFTVAIVRNTQPGRIPREQDSIWRRIYHRLRRPKLPKGDKKELVE